MRGRPRKPTKQLEDKGAFEKDPQRAAARSAEPKPNGPAGDPPDYFDEYQRAIWFEVLDECHKGVVTKADRKQLEIITRLIAKMRLVPARIPRWIEFLGDALEAAGFENFEIERAKQEIRAALGISAQELTLLSTALTRMGMTPADRSRVQVEPDKPKDDPFAAIAATLAGRGPAKSVQ